MADRDRHWKAGLLLRILYFLLLGIAAYIDCLRAYQSIPAEGVLDALDWVVLLIPAACIFAEIIRNKCQLLRFCVLLSPYVWAAVTGMVWSIAALLD